MHAFTFRKRGIRSDRRKLRVIPKEPCLDGLRVQVLVNFDLVIIVTILYFIHEYCMYKRRNKTLINVQRKLIANNSWRPLKVYDNETA